MTDCTVWTGYLGSWCTGKPVCKWQLAFQVRGRCVWPSGGSVSPLTVLTWCNSTAQGKEKSIIFVWCTMPWRPVRIVEVLFNTFLTLAPLDGRESPTSRSSRATSRERAQNTHCVRQRVGPRSCLNTVEKICSSAWSRTSIIDHIVSQLLYWLSCTVFLVHLFIAFWCVYLRESVPM